MPVYSRPLYSIFVVAVGSPVGRLPALTPPNMHMINCTILQHSSFAELSILPIGVCVARVGLRLGAVAVAVALWDYGSRATVALAFLACGPQERMGVEWMGSGMVSSSRCRPVRGTKLYTE